jgi:hypothetical protein
MKKLLLITVLTLMSNLCLFASSDLKLVKGSVAELKGSKATICAKWDYSNSTIENKAINDFLNEKGDEWKRDYPKEIAKAEENFLSRLKDKASKHVTPVEGDDADYKIVVKVKNFSYGSTGASVWVGFGAGDARMWGTLEIYKKGASEPIAVIDIDGAGGSGYGNEKRRVECYREMAELLADILKKGK